MNKNDHSPKFVKEAYRFNVTENNKPGYVIGTVNATDADGDILTYALDNNSKFNSIMTELFRCL